MSFFACLGFDAKFVNVGVTFTTHDVMPTLTSCT